MTRNGKIARLPRSVRDQLNCRLQDGEEGNTLLEWLNALPKVQAVLKWQFADQPISKQNLSEWRLGGYREWERNEESCDLVRRLTEQTDDLADKAEGIELSHRLAMVVTVEVARMTEALLKDVSDPQERWRRLRGVLRELAQLRQEDRKTARLLMDRERWEIESERRQKDEFKREMQEAKEKVCAPIWAKLQLNSLAQAFGDGDGGREVAAFILEVQRDLPPGSLTGKAKSDPVKPSQTQSN